MKAGERPRVLLFGDSITQRAFSIEHKGFAAGLSDWYIRKADVINRGFDGYNSRMLLFALPNLLDSLGNIDLSVVFIGANDSAQSGRPVHIDVEEYQRNVADIISTLRNVNDSMAIILITPPPVNHILWPYRHNNLVLDYVRGLREVVVPENGLSILDLWEDGDWKVQIEDLSDGLHFGAGANEKVLTGLKRIIQLHWPRLSPQEGGEAGGGAERQDRPRGMTNHFPVWEDVAGKDREATRSLMQDWRWKSP